MINLTNQKIKSIFLLVIFFNASAMIEKSWYNTFIENSLQWSIAGATAALIIGKISYNYYQTHLLTHEEFIQNCRSMYKKMYQEIQYYHNFYRNDAQMSDWELKERIFTSDQKEPYPFIIYHASLAKSAWVLKKNILTLHDQLKKINDHQKKLLNSYRTETTAHIEELLLQLTIRGKCLQEYIVKTITLVTILKKRIKLFKEYTDDCCNWSQTERKRKKLSILLQR
jgi:hypothetical protein